MITNAHLRPISFTAVENIMEVGICNMFKIIKFPMFENNLLKTTKFKNYSYSDIIIFGFVFLGGNKKMAYLCKKGI